MMSSDDETLGGLTEALGLNPAKPAEDSLVGKDVGGCTLGRLIAEGGMGRVYEGLQHKPHRAVAVKVLRTGCVSNEGYRRFEREWEMLGQLRHPNIAQIYAAGVCVVSGMHVPYIVMEYLADAKPLTRFAESHGLPLEARIRLFRKVCKAISHAHEKGVIHRDLKPSNILVEPSGIPKVIDFGVARRTDATSEPVTALTDVGQALGTVQYMSPEQLSGDPSQIAPSTDVYALGVILYELLIGKPPYDVRRKPYHEAARVVRLHVVVPPSQVNPGIPPVVDRVIERCLRKDGMARFASAFELAKALDVRPARKKRGAAVLNPHGQAENSAPPKASVSVGGAEILACPHCDRMFRAEPAALGKKIRCRGCRQVFQVPKDTSGVPLSVREESVSTPPFAAICLIDGQDARRCPECGRTFLMKPSFAGKRIRCRGCKMPFRVAHSKEASEAAAAMPEESAPAVAPPRIFDDIGDVLDEVCPGENIASVVRPRTALRKPLGGPNHHPNPFRRPFI